MNERREAGCSTTTIILPEIQTKKGFFPNSGLPLRVLVVVQKSSSWYATVGSGLGASACRRFAPFAGACRGLPAPVPGPSLFPSQNPIIPAVPATFPNSMTTSTKFSHSEFFRAPYFPGPGYDFQDFLHPVNSHCSGN